MRFRRVSGIFAASALLLISATAAYADPPTELPAPTVSYAQFPWTPGADGQNHYRIAGAGCIDIERNLPGVVTVSVTEPNGTVSTESVTADGAGGWEAFIGPSGAPVGTTTVAATCDVYNTAVPYPAASLEIAAAPSSLPALDVTLTSDDDTADVVISGAGCVAEDGTPGIVSYAAVLPDGAVAPDFLDAGADGSWSVSYDGDLGNYEFEAVCHVSGVDIGYDPIAFEVYDTATGPSASPADTPANQPAAGPRAGTPTGTGSQAGPQLAATGTHTATLGWTALALLGAGVALSSVGRRRTS